MEQITAALLSYGMSGKVFHAPFIHLHEGFELAGAWERSKKLIVEDYPGVKSYPTLESLLGDSAVDLVIVNTPIYTHFEYARKALLADKNVVVEKAFTTTSDEAKELVELASSRRRMLSVFQNRRWDSDYLSVKKVIADGVLGDIVEAALSYDRYNPVLSPKSHKETPGSGAGVVYDLGPHLIDQSLDLFGMPKSLFADVMITRDGSRVPDYFEVLLYYDGFRVRLHAGYFLRETVPSFVFHGKNGSFLKSRGDVQEGQLQEGMKPDAEEYGIEPEEEWGILHTAISPDNVIRERVEPPKGNYESYYDGIYQSIRHGAPVEVSGTDGLNTIRIIEAIYESQQARGVVDL